MLTAKIRGVTLISIAIFGFLVYVYFLFETNFGIVLMKFTIMVLITIIFFIIGWIGFTLTTEEKNKKEEDNI